MKFKSRIFLGVGDLLGGFIEKMRAGKRLRGFPDTLAADKAFEIVHKSTWQILLFAEE